MASYVCPWWAASFTIATPLRRWIHDPRKIVGPYVKPGMTVLDIGCGVGWFSVPMAEMVGTQGSVLAVDLQPQMLDMLRRRAEKAGMADRIRLHPCEKDRLGIAAEVDFALVFAMLHEVPDQNRMLGEILQALKPGGKLLLAEPPIHVTAKTFSKEAAMAEETGFQLLERPRLRWSHAAVFAKVAPK